MCGFCSESIKELVLLRTGQTAISSQPVTIVKEIGSGSYNTNLLEQKANEIYVGSFSIQKLSNEFSGKAKVNITFFDVIYPYTVNPSHQPLYLDNQLISSISIEANVSASDNIDQTEAALFTFQGHRIRI